MAYPSGLERLDCLATAEPSGDGCANPARGAERSGTAHRAKNLQTLAQLRSRCISLPFDDQAAEAYGRIRAYLTSAGQVIGANDMLIAAIALANSSTMVTHNTAEFIRVPGMFIEDWQVP